MSCTHEELCKFPSPEDNRFKGFKKLLEVMVDQIEEKAQAVVAESSLKRKRDSPLLQPKTEQGASSIDLPE